jgi:hypothetical protein
MSVLIDYGARPYSTGESVILGTYSIIQKKKAKQIPAPSFMTMVRRCDAIVTIIYWRLSEQLGAPLRQKSTIQQIILEPEVL